MAEAIDLALFVSRGPAEAGHYARILNSPAEAGHYGRIPRGPAEAGHYGRTRSAML